jgi:hypothetical protein
VSKPRQIAGYIGRYLRHSAIAESRISEFNTATNMVTYWFVDEYKVKQFVTLHAFEFIDRLVRLISDKNLEFIRYYGLYSGRTTAKLQKMLIPLSRENVPVKPKRAVILCSNCGHVMDLVGVTRSDEGGGLVYDEWDDEHEHADW